MPLMHLAHCSGNSALCSASHFLACVPEAPLSFLGSNNSQINFLGGKTQKCNRFEKIKRTIILKKKKKGGGAIVRR